MTGCAEDPTCRMRRLRTHMTPTTSSCPPFKRGCPHDWSFITAFPTTQQERQRRKTCSAAAPSYVNGGGLRFIRQTYFPSIFAWQFIA